MSDDLISRKALKQAVDIDFYEHYTKYHDTDQTVLIGMVMDDIDEMPVAFDKKKVIKELDECRKLMLSPISRDCFGEECRESDCMACVFSKAIEIVENGGLND